MTSDHPDTAHETKKKAPRLRLVLRAAFSIAVFLISLELGLQLAHLIFARLRPVETPPHPGAPVILCVGDSHTYGLYVADDQTYPAQLQKLLDDHNLPANVVNRGVPGMNTSQLRRRLPDWIAQYRPTVVIVLAGANDDWNIADANWSAARDTQGPDAKPDRTSALASLALHLRTVKLVILIRDRGGLFRQRGETSRGRDGYPLFLQYHDPAAPAITPQIIEDRARRDLAAIALLCREHGAQPVFLTYVNQPLRPQGLINSIIRDVAREHNVTLVDTDAAIRPLFWPDDDHVNWKLRDQLFSPEKTGEHLAAPGYELVARQILPALKNLIFNAK